MAPRSRGSLEADTTRCEVAGAGRRRRPSAPGANGSKRRRSRPRAAGRLSADDAHRLGNLPLRSPRCPSPLHARHPARRAAEIRLADALLGMMGEARHRVATVRRGQRIADADLREQHRAYHQSRVRVGGERRRPRRWSSKPIVTATRCRPSTASTPSTYGGAVTIADVLARIDRQLAAENDLWTRMTQAFKPVDALVRKALARAAVNRVYAVPESALRFRLEAHLAAGQRQSDRLPGTDVSLVRLPAGSAVVTPRRSGIGGKTANVLARLRGTENPDLIYVVSSHFDSVAGGPGADDDTSGTAALLEAARMLARHAAAGHGDLRVVHGRGGGTARQPRVRPPGRGERSGTSSARSTTT